MSRIPEIRNKLKLRYLLPLAVILLLITGAAVLTSNNPSEQDIKDAQQHAEEQGICTTQYAVMQSPHDPDITYTATNGCELQYLNNEGWKIKK